MMQPVNDQPTPQGSRTDRGDGPATPDPLIRVLLIEDNLEDARLLQEALEGEKGARFELTHVDRLSAGLKCLAQGGLDVVLLDLLLPDSEGLETLVEVRRQGARVPIVVLTASDDELLALQALQRGAQDYLVKGYVQVYRNLLGRSIRYAIERSRAERLKDEFVNTVSHELRTPLSTIREFTGILFDQISGPLTSEQREYLAIIQSNLDRLTRMIDNLLDMAKIEAGHAMLSKEVVEIAAVVGHTADTMRPLAKSKQLELELKLPEELPTLYADVDKITQVLVNLIGNAIKFTPRPGRITISASEGANDIEFSVTDAGIGIAEKDLPKLFEKFQQLHAIAGGGALKGTGLGLAISKRLVELHGGRIWATSQPDRGSTFSFALPKYHEAELFHEFFKSGIEKAKRKQGRFSIVVISVGNFQELKARYGREATSGLLGEVEAALRGAVRRRDGGDLVLRWRRGAMVVILAEADLAGAAAMAERIKRFIEQRPFSIGSDPVTVPIVTAAATYPDEGTTETELLRITEQQLHRPVQPQARILVVDDEPKVRQVLREALELEQYDVFTAASGPEALEQLKRQPVDLVLLDVIMPVMDGYEVYHLLKENPKTRAIPVIIVTAKGERKDRQLGLNGAAYNYLAKPFEIEALLAKVREVLGQQSVAS